MLEATHTAIFIICFLFLFGIITPLLSRWFKFSLTWPLVVIYLALMFGVILDFSHLSNEVRVIIAAGSVLVSVVFIYSQAVVHTKKGNAPSLAPELSLKHKDWEAKFNFRKRRNEELQEDLSEDDLIECTTSPTEEYVSVRKERPRRNSRELPADMHELNLRRLQTDTPASELSGVRRYPNEPYPDSAHSRPAVSGRIRSGITRGVPEDPFDTTQVPGIRK